MAEVLVKGEGLAVGKEIAVEGKNTYLRQIVASLQNKHQAIKKAAKNELVAVKVNQPVKRGDNVFLLQSTV